jgi:hypothetical protein
MRTDDALKIFQRLGPYTSRYASVFRVILDAVSCYKEICHENKKVNVQTSLLPYFIRYIEEEPLPSTSASLFTFAGSSASTDPSPLLSYLPLLLKFLLQGMVLMISYNYLTLSSLLRGLLSTPPLLMTTIHTPLKSLP